MTYHFIGRANIPSGDGRDRERATSVSGATARRWLVFNAVGLIGAGIQLLVFVLLVGVGHIGYLAATPLAVEAAVLHNFVWHQHWTWRDRPGSARDAFTRLLRFHATNGAVSILGGMALMRVLVDSASVSPVAANGIAIVGCSLVNFLLGDRLVFAPAAPGDAARRL